MQYTERQGKKSRAQQRKEKKQQQLQQLIQDAHDEVENGPPMVDKKEQEDRDMDDLLGTMKLKLHAIPADGHCLYRAIVHQLHLEAEKTNMPAMIADYQELRQLTGQYMLDHANDFQPFLSNKSGDPMSAEDYEEYCQKVMDSSEWGGQIELTAMARLLKRSIQVIQVGAPIVTLEPSSEEGGKSKKAVVETVPLMVAYHRHSYGLGEHYNSLVSI